MEYQIGYFSPLGNAKKLADAFAAGLPTGAYAVDVSVEDMEPAQCNILGFELNEGNFRAIPYRVMETLDQLEGTAVAIYVTSSLMPDKAMEDQVERALLPFIPDSCDYRGIWMCAGQASSAFLRNVKQLVAQRPDDNTVQTMDKNAQATVNHPDEEDIRNGLDFICNAF